MKGYLHSIQTMGTVDGPGIRYVIFTQGCKLRCAYCHNPDTWALGKGEYCEAAGIAADAARYKSYFGKTGGVTVSGGEPLLQASFVADLFAACHDFGIHTCLDTSGSVWNDNVLSLLDVTDHCLLDIKFSNETDYYRHTGGHLKDAMRFLQKLQEQDIPTWVRQVIVPGINDTKENIYTLNGLIAPYPCVKRVELLPFETLCLEKYEEMGLPFRLAGYDATPPAVIQALEQHVVLPE